MRLQLLINEPPLQVLPSLAIKIGLNEAIILQQVHYWLSPKRNQNYFNERYWVRNTYEQWQKEQFPFWCKTTIRSSIKSLEDKLLLLTHIDSSNFRKVKYYSIDYDQLNKISDVNDDKPYNAKPSENINFIPTILNQQLDVSESDTSSIGIRHIELLNVGRRSVESRQTELSESDSSYIESETTYSENTLSSPKSSSQGSPKKEKEELPKIMQKYNYESIDKLDLDASGLLPLTKNLNNPLNHPHTNTPAFKSTCETGLYQKMINVWNCQVQAKIKDAPRKELLLNDSRKKSLEILLNEILGGNYVEWEQYCTQIAGTQFLLGGNSSGFKVSLEWAIKPENALKVLEGRIYDKPEAQSQKIKNLDADDFEVELRDHFSQKNYPKEWLKVYQILAKEVGQAAFLSWIKPCLPQSIVEGVAVIIAPTRFNRDYLNTNYFGDITRAVKTVFSDFKELTIEVKA